MNWAWTIALPPSLKLVLMALADMADDDGVCWPAVRWLAHKCTMTERTVQRTLATLQAHELVAVEPRFHANGSRSSNRYRLALNGAPDILSGSPGNATTTPEPLRTRFDGSSRHPPATPASPPGAGDVTRTTIESSAEPSSQPPPRDEAPRGGSNDLAPGDGGRCEPLIYPIALTSAHRTALDVVLQGLDRHVAQLLLDELAGRMAITEVRNPLRYCEVLLRRFLSGDFRPELGIGVVAQREARAAIQTRLAESRASQPTSSPALPQDLRRRIDRMRSRNATDSSTNVTDASSKPSVDAGE